MTGTPDFFDVEIEQSLLGSMLIDETAIARAAAIVDPDDFFDPLHQRLAAFMFAEHAEGRIVSPITVGARMGNDPGLIELAGETKSRDPKLYLRSLARGAPALPNIEDYARIIAEHRSKRDASDAMDYAREMFASDQTVADALSPLITVFDNAQARGQTVESSRSIGEAANALLKEGEEAEKRGRQIAAPTGIKDLDDVIGGLYPENLIIIGGRPGMGKSILGMTVCRAAAAAGWAPHLFSLEMAGRECSARMIADLDYDAAVERGKRGLAYSNLLHHRGMSTDEWDRSIMAQGELMTMQIEVNDRDRLTIAQIAGLARARASRLGKPPVIVIDHLQIVAPSERSKLRTRNDEITEITGGGKQLAKRLKCPVIMLSQLNRQVESREDKHPVMADFRESGSVEQDADVVAALYRPAYYAAAQIRHAKTTEHRANAETVAENTKNLLEIDILKNRNGPTKTVQAWIEVRSSVIRDVGPAKPVVPQSDLLSLAAG